jgi:hypothetical protein
VFLLSVVRVLIFLGGEMMDELIKLVSTKAGISADQAKIAVSTVIDFLKSKLPAPVASQLDAILKGNPAGNVADAAKGLGNMLGKK